MNIQMNYNPYKNYLDEIRQRNYNQRRERIQYYQQRNNIKRKNHLTRIGHPRYNNPIHNKFKNDWQRQNKYHNQRHKYQGYPFYF